jgi:hypothetical protein
MTIADRMKSKRADTRAQAKREMRMNAMLTEEMNQSPSRGLAMKAKGTGARELRQEDMPEPNPGSCWTCGSQRARGTPTRQEGERPSPGPLTQSLDNVRRWWMD